MEAFWPEVLEFARTTSEGLGRKLVLDFARLTPTRKADGTLVTQADWQADREIRQAIEAAFPEHGVLTEEGEHVFPPQDWCWVVDPIDGTTNFTRGLPVWGISLGLLYRGTPVFGFVHLPQLQQSFYGYWYGDSGLTGPTGAYLNGEAIHTSGDAPSLNHLCNICARSTRALSQPFPCKIRLLGVASYNLLLVACGAALAGVEAAPKVWDIAAAWAILQAAGGTFVPLDGAAPFPLKVGQDYGSRSFPCLTASRAELIPTFWPLVAFLGRS